MQYKVGEQVFHPVYGVGKIVAIKELQINGAEPNLYYEVMIDTTTVWVLIDPDKIGRLRPITPKSELAGYRRLLKSHPISLDRDFRTRRNDLNSRFKEGTLQATCEIVRDLSARRYLKPLTGYESTLLHRAGEFLIQEWAMVNGLTATEAARDVQALLVEGRKE